MAGEAPLRALDVRPLTLPLKRPMQTAAGTMTATPLVLLDLSDEDGATGRSYLRTYTPLALRALAVLLDDLTPLLAGATADPHALMPAMRGRFALLGSRGLAGAALAGIDMALWDLAARRAGRSLADHLGADPSAVPAYPTLSAAEPREAAGEAESAAEEGFTAVKVKVGHGPVADDIRLIGAIRAAVGREIAVMIDYNQSLSVREAIDRARVLAAEQPTWIEEPTDGHDLAGHARIAAATDIPINLGENAESAAEIAAIGALGAAGELTLDAMKIGGVSGWHAPAAHAGRAGLPVSSHAFPEYSVHLLAATPTRRWLEHLDYVGPILRAPLAVRRGMAEVPSSPGAGIEWDERAIGRLAASA